MHELPVCANMCDGAYRDTQDEKQKSETSEMEFDTAEKQPGQQGISKAKVM